MRIEEFQVLQLIHQLGKVIIGDGRLAEHIIIIVVLVDFLPKLMYLFFWGHIRGLLRYNYNV